MLDGCPKVMISTEGCTGYSFQFECLKFMGNGLRLAE